jgi:hypothetical protein
MDFIHTNIKFLRKQKGWTQEQLATELEIKRSLIGSYEEGRAKPNYEVLAVIAKTYKVSIDSLITRDLRLTEKVSIFTDEQLDVAGKGLRVLAITVDKDNKENIEMVPVKAAAGYLNGYGDPTFIKELNRFRLPFLPAGTYRAFEIKGDSMLPLPPGSVVVSEYIDDWTKIKDGQTYVILSKQDGIVYKRVFNQIAESSSLILRSDNTSYPAYSIQTQDILEVWRAVLHISSLNKETNPSYQDILQLMQEIKNEVAELKSVKSKE